MTPGPPTSSRRNRTTLIVLAALGAVAALISLLKKDPGDFQVYLDGAQHLLEHGELFRTQDAEKFPYPPFFALLFVPMLWTPENARRILWALLNGAAVAAILGLTARRISPYLRKPGHAATAVPPVWYWLTVGVLAFRHIGASLENKSHDLIVMLLVVLAVDAWCAGKYILSGAWAGIAAACKATPLLLALLFLEQRKWWAIAALLIAAAGATLLTDALFPLPNHKLRGVQWYQQIAADQKIGESAAGAAWRPWRPLNQSLAGTLHRLFARPHEKRADQDISLTVLPPRALRAAILAAQLAVLALIVWTCWPGIGRWTTPDDVALRRWGQGAMIVTGMVLLSPMSSKAHFCVLLLPITFCLVHALYRRRDAVLIGLLALVLVTGTLTAKDLWGERTGNLILSYGPVTWCAVACLTATGYVMLSKQFWEEMKSNPA